MATVTIDILTKQSGDGFTKVKGQIEDVEKASKSADKSSQSWLGGMLQFAAGGLLAQGISAIGGQVKDFVQGSMSAAKESQMIMAQTEAVVKSTGAAAGYSAQQIQEMAQSLSAAAGKSLFDDDDIQRGQNMLLTFTNIKETLPDATAVMIDVATAMKTDVKGGAIQLGKALNDPIKGVGALSKIGVTFDETQKKMIKTLVKSGQTAEAQRIILAELKKEFGGSAEAAARADGGMAQLTAQIGDLQKELGAALLPIFGKVVSFIAGSVMPVIQALAVVIEALFRPVGNMGDELVVLTDALGITGKQADALIGAIEPLLSGINTFIATLQNGGSVIDAFQASWGTISEGISRIGTAIVGALSEALPQIVNGVSKWGSALIEWIVPMIPGMLEQLGKFAGELFNWIVSSNTEVAKKIAEWGTQLWAWIQPQIGPMLVKLGEMANQLWGWIQEQAGPLLTKLQIWANQFIAWIVPMTVKFLAEWPGMLNKFLDWIGTAAAPLLDKLGKWAIEFIAWIAPMIPPFLIALAGISAAMLVWVGETVWTLTTKLVEWAGAFLGWIGKNVLPKLGDALGEMLTAIGKWIDGSVKNLEAMAVSMGLNLINGIIKGIQDNIKLLNDAIKKAMEDAVAAAKAALGIKSPSLVFRHEVGAQIAAGMAQGIQSGMPMVAASAGALGGAALSGARMTTQNYYQYSPTYSSTPVSPVADFRMMESIARMI